MCVTYLNGMFLKRKTRIRTVATDGHRLAVCAMDIGQSLPGHSVIVPRKGVIELMRLLDGSGRVYYSYKLAVIITRSCRRLFTSKLVDGRFPDYRHVLPKNPTKTVIAGCDILKQAFSRAAILSNEKFRGIVLTSLMDD
ncbi:DNA polymerase III subunit beta family protein [Enterobacter hormaechei]